MLPEQKRESEFMNNKTEQNKKSGWTRTAGLGVFSLAMINVAAIVSLRGLPAESVYGLSSAFYYLFAALFFLIPVSLVAAELTTGWPQKGGVFRWVGEAFGTRAGFLAIWLQWIQTTIWFPTVLTFAAVSIAFIGPNQSWDAALSSNSVYVLCLVLAVYWLATLINIFFLIISIIFYSQQIFINHFFFGFYKILEL